MSVDSKQVIGIDFGTSNSYFCKFLTESDGHKTRTLDFGNDQVGSISSTIMYRPDKSNLIGTIAEQEWGESSNKEKKSYKLRTHFKPDIIVDPEAKQYAVDFLQTIVTQLQAKRINFVPDKHKVIMGVPAQASEEYKKTLTTIARKAGYGEIKLLPEPVGALIYHLWNKDLSARQTQGGILVVDFGGGTCDFTYMQHLDVCKAWGDMYLGGRLFDDLFYQWFLDQNPEAEQKLQKEGDEYYVHWVLCKKVKEFFSNSMALNRSESLKWKVGEIKHYGAFNNLTWEEFTKRAEKYSPNKSFLDYLNNTKQKSNIISNNNSIDLINWFKQSLITGLEQNNIRSSDIERVILTGGSSQWPFVEDTICDVLHINKDNLLMSGNPKAAIGEGLVMLPYLKNKLSKVTTKIKKDMDSFLNDVLIKEINSKINITFQSMLKEISSMLFDDCIRNSLLFFKKNGGTIISLQERIEADVYAAEPILKKIVSNKMDIIKSGLPEAVHISILSWFKTHGITYTGNKLNLHGIQDGHLNNTMFNNINSFSKFDELIINNVSSFTMTIGVILFTVFSSSFVLEGPIGWVIGGIIGSISAIIFGYLRLRYGKEKAKEYVKSINISSKITNVIFGKKLINKTIKSNKKTFENEFRVEFEKSLDQPIIEMKDNLKIAIEREVDSLSVINQL